MLFLMGIRFDLGELEELVLLVVASLGDEAYGVRVRDALDAQAGRSVTLSSVHAVLHRLQKKGFLTSSVGGATAARGGRRKRFFTLTAAGFAAIRQRQQLRRDLWLQIPNLGLGYD